ncbi:MAG: thioredoxin domain-containing protein, partial [Actinobacteria bacterium]|nr:thioredoxin domain-containing protein [Actinomycetota bacterium]
MAKQPGKDNFTRNLVIAVVVGVLLIMLVPTLLSRQTDSSASIPANVSADRGYGVVFNGELTGVPVVDIYEDFQCPVCAQFTQLNGPYIESLIAEKKATVVYHTLSFLGPESVNAANAAACSADEGKFLDFHRLLMMNQKQENSGAWDNTFLASLGQTAGITSQKFSSCVNKGEYVGWVSNVAAAGAKANVNSTPTVFV